MISLHVILYTSGEGDRFKVQAVDDKDPSLVRDATDEYDVVALTTEDGREGFAVLKKCEATSGG